MKERRGGSFGDMVGGIAGQVALTVKRRQQDREPRVLLYGDDGRPSVLRQGAHYREAIVETAGRLIELSTVRRPPEEPEAEAPGPDDDDPLA
ncbi:MAG: hypothetical protein QOJ07_932 [Thermoleophilaceae bacterium]|nr:hypothetical protein [Thermoleophilaceae bacterium]